MSINETASESDLLKNYVCEHCGGDLKPGHVIWMELNNSTRMYAGPSDPAWPEEDSQGDWPLHPSCAHTVLRLQGETGEPVEPVDLEDTPDTPDTPDLWPGCTLRNGYIVLQFDPETRVVLAMNPEDAYCQFVTWDVYECGGTIGGDYHVGLRAALDAYDSRVAVSRR